MSNAASCAGRQESLKLETGPTGMNEQEFWRIVEQARAGGVDDEARVSALISILRTLSAGESAGFDEMRMQLMARIHTADLWAAAYLILEGCSDDGFDYFKGWLIMQGESTFERVSAQPDALADLEDLDWPSLEEALYAAGRAHQETTGQPLVTRTKVRRPELNLWDFESADEMKKHLPKLWRRFGADAG